MSSIPVQQQSTSATTAVVPSISSNSSNGSLSSSKQFAASEDFVADPLPFNYADFQNNHEMAGREMINMAHSIIGSTAAAGAAGGAPEARRSLQHEPKVLREPQPHHYASYGMPPQAHHHHPSMHYSLPHQQQQAQQHHHHQLQQSQQQQQYMQAAQHHHHPMMYNTVPQGMQTNHSFQAMLDHHSSRKDHAVGPSTAANTTPTSASQVQQQQVVQQQQHHQQVQQQHQVVQQQQQHFHHPPQHFNMPYINTHSVQPTTPQQEVAIKLKTGLKAKYWRNGRRNLQCFPSCKVFGDYSYIKIDDLKQHDFMWGKCRGSLVAEIALNGSFTFDDLVILGRIHSLENIPVPFEEAVMGECMIGRIVASDIMDIMKEQWISGERLPDFMHQSTRAACFEFKPKVWKYSEDMSHGKCKRRNVRYYVQFEAFVPVFQGDVRSFMCVGSGMSTSFEVGSSRVLARQKRKAAGRTVEPVKRVKTIADAAPASIISTGNILMDQQVQAQQHSTGNILMDQLVQQQVKQQSTGNILMDQQVQQQKSQQQQHSTGNILMDQQVQQQKSQQQHSTGNILMDQAQQHSGTAILLAVAPVILAPPKAFAKLEPESEPANEVITTTTL